VIVKDCETEPPDPVLGEAVYVTIQEPFPVNEPLNVRVEALKLMPGGKLVAV